MKRNGIFLFFLALFCSLLAAAGRFVRDRAIESASSQTVSASEDALSGSLYAKYAVLLDGDSGRILFGKMEDEAAPMASTTKIMTLITALEMENVPDACIVSPRAAREPKVHLGASAGTVFRTEDLYYSMMLESHNDSAFCLAENLGAAAENAEENAAESAEESAQENEAKNEAESAQDAQGIYGDASATASGGESSGNEAIAVSTGEDSERRVEIFLTKMNEKAEAIGCTDTYFLTPNGLDETDADGMAHHSTAADLARILKYCVYDSPKREQFLAITRTASYTFSDADGKTQYTCTNHNRLLETMDGAVSGKTGFTALAGYCYVGAVERGGKKFVAALLACGWPNNRNYKWRDMEKLISYGDETFERADLADTEPVRGAVVVNNAKGAAAGTDAKGGDAENSVKEEDVGKKQTLLLAADPPSYAFLKRKGEEVRTVCRVPESVEAPVQKGDALGSVTYLCGDEVLTETTLLACSDAEKIDFTWCIYKIFCNFYV